MALVHVGPHTAIRRDYAFRGCTVSSFLFAPTNDLQHVPPAPSGAQDSADWLLTGCRRRASPVAPLLFDLAQILDVLADADPEHATEYLRKSHADRAAPVAIRHGAARYISPVDLKARLQSLPSSCQETTSILTFLHTQVQNRVPASAFGTVRLRRPMDGDLLRVSTPERLFTPPRHATLDIASHDETAPASPVDGQDGAVSSSSTADPPAVPEPPKRKRGRPKQPKADPAPRPETPPPTATPHPDASACMQTYRDMMAPYMDDAVHFGGETADRHLRQHMAWCMYLLATGRVDATMATKLIDLYVYAVFQPVRAPPPVVLDDTPLPILSTRKRKAATQDGTLSKIPKIPKTEPQ